MNFLRTASQPEFELLALPHTPSLLRFAKRLTGDVAAAEDLVQDTLLLAWRGFHNYQRETNIRAWLFRILVNTFHRQGKRKVALEPVPGAHPAQATVQESLEILQALSRLPEDQQAVLLLCIVEGFTAREAAEILAIPMGTVMSRLSRGRDALRTALTVEPAQEKR